MALTVLSMNGCKDRIPLENTDDYNRLHGIVNDGKTVNEITLFNVRNNNHPKLRFPPSISVGVNTPGTHNSDPTPIRKGFAYEASITLELNDQKRLIPIVRTPDHLVYDTVKIVFHASSGLENAKRVEARLQEISQLSVRTTSRPEWGLYEFVLVAPKTDQIMSYEYVPINKKFRSTDGARMWIGCHAGGSKLTNNEGPASCASHFNYQDELSVAYIYDARHLPYWHEIYEEVVRFTDSALVK